MRGCSAHGDVSEGRCSQAWPLMLPPHAGRVSCLHVLLGLCISRPSCYQWELGPEAALFCLLFMYCILSRLLLHRRSVWGTWTRKGRFLQPSVSPRVTRWHGQPQGFSPRSLPASTPAQLASRAPPPGRVGAGPARRPGPAL